MARALEEVAAGMTMRRAARVFHVPRNTLWDRIRGRVTHGCRTGPAQLLSPADESSLVQYVVYCFQHGYPLTKVRLLAYANAVRRKRSPNTIAPPLGQTWWLAFKRRHLAELSMRTPDVMDRGRAIFGRRWTVEKYFHLLTTTMEELGLRDKPHHIYNCDETGLNMEQSRCRVLAPLGAAHVYQQAQGTRDHLSVLACLNAVG